MGKREKFIYVFDDEAKGEAIAKGFVVVKQDLMKHTYILRTPSNMNFEESDLPFKHVFSDVLSF